MRDYFKSPRRRILLRIAISFLLIGAVALLINTFVVWRQPCPDGWSCQDIGNPQQAGNESISGDTWIITASGSGIGTSSADQFRFVSQSVRGDTQLTAQVTRLSNNATSQAGLMLRQTNDPGSPYVAVLASSQHTLVVEYRLAFDGPSTVVSTTALHALPLYLVIQRMGDVYQVGSSTDGTHYTLVPGSTLQMVMPTSILEGLAVSQHAGAGLGSATFSHVTIGPPKVTLAPPPATAPCPTGWHCTDIGNPQVAGSQSLKKQTLIVQGAGDDIAGTWDQFHYVWKTLAADGTLSVHVNLQAPTDPWAKAGLMIRQNPDPAAANYAVFVTPDNGIVVQIRLFNGFIAYLLTSVTGTAPTYLQITRSGNTYTAFTSKDGVTWTAIPDSTFPLDMPGPLMAGLAVTSHQPGLVGAVSFDDFTLSPQAPPAPSSCPAPWTCQDVGPVPLAGSQQFVNQPLNQTNPFSQNWTVLGAGNIGNASDAFRYVWQPMTGNGTLITDVLTQDETDPWASAGLMLRASLAANAAYYAVLMTPGHGLIVQYRSAAGAQAVIQTSIPLGTPAYLQIGRVGNTLTAYTSTNEQDWVPIAGSRVSLNLGASVLAGLAVASHNPQALSTATFDWLQLTPQAQAQINSQVPSQYQDKDILKTRKTLF